MDRVSLDLARYEAQVDDDSRGYEYLLADLKKELELNKEKLAKFVTETKEDVGIEFAGEDLLDVKIEFIEMILKFDADDFNRDDIKEILEEL